MEKDKWQDQDLIFPSLVGIPLQASRLSHEFPELARKAGQVMAKVYQAL